MAEEKVSNTGDVDLVNPWEVTAVLSLRPKTLALHTCSLTMAEEKVSKIRDVDSQVMNPWEVTAKDGGKIEYDKLIEKFLFQRLRDDIVQRVERLTGRPAHVFLRRGVFFAHCILCEEKPELGIRLFTTVRDSLGLTYDVSFETSLFDRLKLVWYVVSVTSTPGKVFKAVDACKDVLRGLHDNKIVQRELDRGLRYHLISTHDLFNLSSGLVLEPSVAFNLSKHWFGELIHAKLFRFFQTWPSFIDDIKAVRYDICGVVRMVTTNSKVKVALTHGPESVKPQMKLTSENGSFCFEVPHGEYRLSALSIKSESSSGLLFSPPYVDVKVNSPVLNVVFFQAQVNVQGTVFCKEKCTQSISVSLVRLVSVTSDGCQASVSPIAGRFGLYISGSVSLALSGVDIKILAADDSYNAPLKKGDLALQSQTGDDGSFIAGPLYNDTSYKVEASMELATIQVVSLAVCDLLCSLRKLYQTNHGNRDFEDLPTLKKLAFFTTRKVEAYEELTWNDFVPSDWQSLLQVLVERMDTTEENESSLIFPLLSNVVDAGKDNIAIHTPFVVSRITATISKHLPPATDPWPQVVERGFAALVVMAQTWDESSDEFGQHENRCYMKLHDSPLKSGAEEENEMSKLDPLQKRKLRQNWLLLLRLHQMKLIRGFRHLSTGQSLSGV
ncbi:hypothetical protein J5N97_015559 [Dioscorea zingiberensis]|uniref:Uncharacterized protein n=1 Tax=Dioscorea zingiberensis TaxID=325984 RepID=A0A9D5HEF4_9LILI|nr:hypothetical protein J5N97_015559 [Dioscorea zingiberensis]